MSDLQRTADADLVRITTEEEKTLARVLANAHPTRDTSRKDYDQELLELRDAIGEARLEDVPALLAEMERLRNVANRRAEVVTGAINPASPYFGHMKLLENGRVRDVLIGNSTYVDIDSGVRIVDWRDAPVSKIYYRYSEGDPYEEEIGGRLVEGEVTLRRAVVIRDSKLRRIIAPQGTFHCIKGTWTRGEESPAKLAGGQLTAVRPPTEEERRAAATRKGKLGTGVEGREDRHLPEIPALIDPRQFELITKPHSGIVLIQGGAGSGKTTIGLHRMAWLAFNHPKRFTPDKMLVVVFNRALASYIVRVLPALGVEGVQVITYAEWITKVRQRHVPRAPNDYAEDTPTVVTRLKKHPIMLRLIDARVAKEEASAKEELLQVAERTGVGEIIERAWHALDGSPLSRRIAGMMQWLRGERELAGVEGPSLGSRAVHDLQKPLDRWNRRARDIVWDWAEIVTDAKAIIEAVETYAPGDFSHDEIASAVRWSSEHLARWVHSEREEDDEETLGREERRAARAERRAARARKRAEAREDDFEREEIALGEAIVEARESIRSWREDGRDEENDDLLDDSPGPAVGADGVVEDSDPPVIDVEDDALFVRLYQVKRGPLRASAKQPLRYEHIFIDEAQDLSPVELAVVMGTSSEDRSVTLAGDTAQRLLMDNGFSDWRGVLRDLGLQGVEVEPLRIGYRSTLEVLAFARAVLGPLADPEPPLATRHGAPVELHTFPDVGSAVAFLGEALRALSLEEPRANVCVIARDPERAEVYYQGLERAEIPRLSRVRDQDFCFRPGVEVTDIRQVKGLEFDYVILVDVTASQYPADDESRHLLHIGATRAAHQLWIIATGTPSPLLPSYMFDDPSS
jgi:DNA helicase-2/ATP-dependent DNA helicase PcrA